MKDLGILLDHDRERRIGFDEAIFAESKSIAQLEAIAAHDPGPPRVGRDRALHGGADGGLGRVG